MATTKSGAKRLLCIGVPMFAAAFLLLLLRIYRQPPSMFSAPRELGGSETVTVDYPWTWHEFEFQEPADEVESRLAGWRSRLEASHLEYAMTDMEVRDDVPDTWAPESALSIQEISLRPGMNCGFAVGVIAKPSALERAKAWLRKHL